MNLLWNDLGSSIKQFRQWFRRFSGVGGTWNKPMSQRERCRLQTRAAQEGVSVYDL